MTADVFTRLFIALGLLLAAAGNAALAPRA